MTDIVDLRGQVAIVTGGGRGLGRAFAQGLAQAGASVVVTGRRVSPIAETVSLIEAEGGQSLFFQGDVTDDAAMRKIVVETEQRFGPIDLLVNNAAILTPLGYPWDVDPVAWWRILEVNIRGPHVCMLAVLPGMMARRAGRIINVSSGAAEVVFPHWAAYCASKAALSALTNNMAPPLKDYGISMFALGPSGHTAMIDELLESPAVPEDVKQPFRVGIAQDPNNTEIAASVHMLKFLASGQADFLTGRHLNCDDSLDKIMRQQEVIVKDDLYTLRRRTL